VKRWAKTTTESASLKRQPLGPPRLSSQYVYPRRSHYELELFDIGYNVLNHITRSRKIS
jgi:hypothetical protein